MPEIVQLTPFSVIRPARRDITLLCAYCVIAVIVTDPSVEFKDFCFWINDLCLFESSNLQL